MSVVPLTIGISVVDKQDDFDCEGKAVLISGLDRSQLESEEARESSNVSYDLRVGRVYKHYRKKKRAELSDDAVITLRPGDAVLIETEEYLHMPRYLFGYVVPKVKLLQLGLTNTLSKVDPGYLGNLVVTLFNVGTTVQRLKRRQAFCQLVLHSVDEGATLYNKGGKQVEGIAQKAPRSLRFNRWIERHKTLLTILSGGLGGAIVTLLARAFGSR